MTIYERAVETYGKDMQLNVAIEELSELIKAVSYCLKYGGRTAICHRADRLIEVVCALKNHGI